MELRIADRGVRSEVSGAMARDFEKRIFQATLRGGVLVWLLVAAWVARAVAAADPASVVPATAPRTWVLAGQREAFRAYCTTGEGAKAFAKIRTDLDRSFLGEPLP